MTEHRNFDLDFFTFSKPKTLSSIFFPPILLMTHLMSNMIRINLSSLFLTLSGGDHFLYRPHKTHLWKGYTEDHLFATSASQPLPLFFQDQGGGQGERCCLQWAQVLWKAEPTSWSQPVTSSWPKVQRKLLYYPSTNIFSIFTPSPIQTGDIQSEFIIWMKGTGFNLYLTTQMCPNWRKRQPHSTCFLSQYSLSFYQWKKITILLFFLLLINMSWDILKRITTTHTRTQKQNKTRTYHQEVKSV